MAGRGGWAQIGRQSSANRNAGGKSLSNDDEKGKSNALRLRRQNSGGRGVNAAAKFARKAMKSEMAQADGQLLEDFQKVRKRYHMRCQVVYIKS
jgi:hypothetical protein